jgi:hypothetical protein
MGRSVCGHRHRRWRDRMYEVLGFCRYPSKAMNYHASGFGLLLIPVTMVVFFYHRTTLVRSGKSCLTLPQVA